jgi:UDPglucose 6-dehydrogenase
MALSFTHCVKEALSQADLLIITVGTPTDPLTGDPLLDSLNDALLEALPYLPLGCSLIIKSTIPVGTTRHLSDLLKQAYPDRTISLYYHPEFLREGSAIADFQNPSRLIIGMDRLPESAESRKLFQQLCMGGPSIHKTPPMVFTNYETAEIIKYTANTLLASKIAFMNEIAELCEAVGGDIQQVAQGVSLDPRIGKAFLETGPGFGGSCFPKDLHALTRITQKLGLHHRIAEAVLDANETHKEKMIQKIRDAMGGTVDDKTIAVLGLTFKPNTDDMRESPSLTIIPGLQRSGAKIQAYDPAGMHQARLCLEDIIYGSNAYEAAEGADAIIVLTEWEEFRRLDLQKLSKTMRTSLMIDLRNLFTKEDMASSHFTYVSLGRPVSMTVDSMNKISA